KMNVADFKQNKHHKYRDKEPNTKQKKQQIFIKNKKNNFPVIFGKASEFMNVIFGSYLNELEPGGHS
ncbi:hypothetical protein Q6312_28465, partial [Klebsiella pneumoniae]|uniref:hypothetical protein n=1 Tax=Klebsiella pneumoniae TaxID=573 RepID=UPI0027314EDA